MNNFNFYQLSMKKIFKHFMLALLVGVFSFSFLPNKTYAQSTSIMDTSNLNACINGTFWYAKVINGGLKYLSSINVRDAAEGKIGMNKDPLCELSSNKPGSFTALRQISNILGVISILGIIMASMFLVWKVMAKHATSLSDSNEKLSGIEVISALFFHASAKNLIGRVLLEVGINFVVALFLVVLIYSSSIF